MGVSRRVYISCLKNTCLANLNFNWQSYKKRQAEKIRDARGKSLEIPELRDIFPSQNGQRVWVELLESDII